MTWAPVTAAECGVARVVAWLAPVAVRAPLLGRPERNATVAAHVARTRKRAAVARVIARACTDARRRPPRGAELPPDDLAEAAAGLRLLAGGAALAAVVPLALVTAPAVAAVGLTATVALVATRAPDALLATAARREAAQLTATLPDLLDIVGAALRAGLTLEESLAIAAEHAAGAARAMLDGVLARLHTGTPASEALVEEGRRLQLGVAVSLGYLVRRHHALGLPLAPALDRLTAAARADACAARRRQVARAVPLATVVTATVVAPACVAALGIALLGSVLAGAGR